MKQLRRDRLFASTDDADKGVEHSSHGGRDQRDSKRHRDHKHTSSYDSDEKRSRKHRKRHKNNDDTELDGHERSRRSHRDLDGDHHHHHHHHRRRHRGHSDKHYERHKFHSHDGHIRPSRKRPPRSSHSLSRSRSRSPRNTKPRTNNTRHDTSNRHRSNSATELSGNSILDRITSRDKHEPQRNDDPLSPLSDDSDPLGDLIGPLPPSKSNNTPLNMRGRGAHNVSSSNIDAHFAASYDPSLDIHPEEERVATSTVAKSTRVRPVAGLASADDDWDMALEALRDRALWRRKGAERLRAAGFGDDVVERWMDRGPFSARVGNGTSADNGGGQDGNIQDVKWGKQGEGREWDRGKVLDDEGDVDVRDPW